MCVIVCNGNCHVNTGVVGYLIYIPVTVIRVCTTLYTLIISRQGSVATQVDSSIRLRLYVCICV